jgi:hypothetical protein
MSRRFKVKDSKGKIYVAYKVSGQPYETTDATSSSKPYNEGSYELEDERPLKYHEDSEEFEIVETGERLTRA